VVLAHIEEYFPSANLTLLRNAGNFSVGLFFILSGMLIATSAWNKRIKSADYGFKAFFLDRFSRIYAALVPALAIVFLTDYSFTLYLVHYSLLGLLTNFISFNAVWIDIIVLFLIVNIVSILVVEPFEKKHKLFRKYLGSRFSA
jgi:peptidoglycan/LPS O-acetylase OafA/YrhL